MTAVLGISAGILTTVAGLGGGVVLVLLLSALWGPLPALAATAPALMFGNLHRAWLYRQHLDRPTAWAFAKGAIPGSLLGGLIATLLPAVVLQGLMLLGVALSLIRALGWLKTQVPPQAVTPAAAVIGALAATSGGAAGLTGGLLLALGHKGERYVATAAISAVALHLGRMVAYGAAGLFTAEIGAKAAVLALTIGIGNLLGARLRTWLPTRVTERAEVGALALAATLALLGPFLHP